MSKSVLSREKCAPGCTERQKIETKLGVHVEGNNPLLCVYAYTPQLSTMRFTLNIRARFRKRAYDRELHRLIKETIVVRAASEELKAIYSENDHGYDPKFEEAVLMCLQIQDQRRR